MYQNLLEDLENLYPSREKTLECHDCQKDLLGSQSEGFNLVFRTEYPEGIFVQSTMKGGGRMYILVRIIAGIGLLFFFYCLVQVISKFKFYDKVEKTLWFIVIAVGSAFCIHFLFR
jgi:hypothetical protein